MKHYLYIAFLFLFSCGTEPDPGTISLEELAGPTGVDDTTTESLAGSGSTAPGHVHSFILSQAGMYDTASHAQPHAIDRFGFSTRQKINFKSRAGMPGAGSETIVPVASFYCYTFSDTTKTKNAFYNWLDCFGKNCEPVELNSDLETIESQPMVTLVYDTTIIAVEYLCETKKYNWKPFQDSLLAKFGKDYNYRIDVACNGPLKWKQGKGH